MSVLKRVTLLVTILFILFFSFQTLQSYDVYNSSLELEFQMNSDKNDEIQVFYSSGKPEWNEELSLRKTYNNNGAWMDMGFVLPQDTKLVRIDVGNQPSNVHIRNMKVDAYTNFNIKPIDVEINGSQNIDFISANNDFVLKSTGNDPFFIFDIQPFIEQANQGLNLFKALKNVLFSLIIGFLAYFIMKNIKNTSLFVKKVLNDPRMILSLAKNDFKTKYASSYLGVIWGFINPLLTIATYWFVFQVGLRSGDVSEVPFILWFIAGIIPWFFFSEALSGATNVFMEYGYLVKKVVFKIEMLPSVKMVSALFVQFFFVIFIFVVYGFYGSAPTFYSFQLLYYLFSMFVLVFSITLLTSSIVLFFKDLNQIIMIVLSIGFWFTPIGWPVSMLPEFWGDFFKLNPMYYIVQGFRDTMIDNVLFYERPYQTAYYWIFCLATLTLSVKVFKKLKVHFSDVL